MTIFPKSDCPCGPRFWPLCCWRAPSLCWRSGASPNALRSVLAVFRAQPLLIILNCLPVGMLLLVFTCLLRNVFFAGALANFAVCALSIANRIKIEVRDEPVFPRDFALLKEAGSAVGTYDIQFPVPSIAAVVVFSLVLVALGLFVGSRPFPIARLRGWVGSLLGAAASFAVLAGLILTVYASNDLYNSFRVSNAYYIPSVFNELGSPTASATSSPPTRWTSLRASAGRRRPAGTRAATPVWGRM